mgnify:CR=1 FL=1
MAGMAAHQHHVVREKDVGRIEQDSVLLVASLLAGVALERDRRTSAEPVAEEAPAKPKRTRKKKADEAPVETVADADPAPAEEAVAAEDEEPAAPRRGWWQRTFGE